MMFDAVATEFPFVQEMPKRERSRFLKVWDAFQEMREIAKTEGSLIPIAFAAKVLDVSRQRVYDLVGDGRLKVVLVNGHQFVTGNSVVAYAESERKAGRPLKIEREIEEQGVNRATWKCSMDTVREARKTGAKIV